MASEKSPQDGDGTVEKTGTGKGGKHQEITELQQQIIRFYHHNPFIDYLRIQVVPLPDGQVRLELPIDEQHTNLYGIAHGGVLMTMADTAMGAACLVCNKKVVTVSLDMEFMHAVPLTEKVVTSATVLHDGSHMMTCESELLSLEGKLFAKAHGVFYVLGKFIDNEDNGD